MISLNFCSDEYRAMKWQWQSMTETQEKNFSEFRERKHLIGKDFEEDKEGSELVVILRCSDA